MGSAHIIVQGRRPCFVQHAFGHILISNEPRQMGFGSFKANYTEACILRKTLHQISKHPALAHDTNAQSVIFTGALTAFRPAAVRDSFAVK